MAETITFNSTSDQKYFTGFPEPNSSQDKSKFTTIDGIEYVNSEYLEDQEFNLEGKNVLYRARWFRQN